MAIGAYPRTTVQGTGNSQNPQNGYGLMIFNATTQKYEAATAATFAAGGGGDATAANQTTQITEAQTTNTTLTSLLNYTKVKDLSKNQGCTATFVALENTSSTKVTLIAQSTNTENIEYQIDGGDSLFLEAGYSVVVNVTNPNKIFIRQTGGAGETAYYIITSTI
jgi:hypothetical protein